MRDLGHVEMKSDYWRNRDGSIAHTDECVYSNSKGSRPWKYADGRSRQEVRDRVATIWWLRLCRVCWKEDSDG